MHWIAAAISLAGSAQAAQPAAAEPDKFNCSARRQSDFGEIWYTINVPVDGSEAFHRIAWDSPRRAEGVSLTVQWHGSAPPPGRFGDEAWAIIRFAVGRRVRGDVRIELRRTPGPHYPREFAYAGRFLPALRRHRNPSRDEAETQARWEEINAWMRGRERLAVALVRRNGDVVAEDRLDAATLALSESAIATIRPEIEAMAADYRNRCEAASPASVVIVD